MKTHIFICSICALFAIPILSYAQNSDTLSINETCIVANRIPEVKTNAAATVTIINSKQIQEMSKLVPDMSHLLGLLTPGLAMSSNTTSSRSQTLRGRSVLVLIDGIPQSTPLRSTDREMRTIDPAAVERIEVIKGANAVYGNGAIGGIINIITKKNHTSKKISGITSLSGTTYNFFTKQGGQGYRINQLLDGKIGNFTYLIDAAYSHSPSAIDGTGQYISPRYGLGDTDTYNDLIKLKYDFNEDNSIEVMYNFYSSLQNTKLIPKGGKYLSEPSIGIFGARDSAAVNEGTRYNHNAYIKYLSKNIFNKTDMQLSLYGSSIYTIFDFRKANPNSPRWEEKSGQSTVKDKKFGASAQFTSKLRLTEQTYTHILYGYDFLINKTSQPLVDGRLWVPELTSYNNAPFVQTKTSLFNLFSLKLGARYDNIIVNVPNYDVLRKKLTDKKISVKGGSLKYNNISFNAGLTFNKYTAFQPFIAFSQGFSIFDLGRSLRDAKNEDVLSSISVQPVKTNNYEIGFYSELFNILQINASYFYTYSPLGSDLEIQDGFWVANRVPQKVNGVELNIDANICKNITLGGNYVYLEGKTSSENNKWDGYMSGLSIPAPKTTLYINYYPIKNSYLSLQYVHTGNRDRFKMNDKGVYEEGKGKVSSINLMNLSAGYSFKNINLNIGIENLLNTVYYTPASMLMARDAEYARGNGRYITLTLSVKY